MYTLKVHHPTHQDGRMKDRDIINIKDYTGLSLMCLYKCELTVMAYWVCMPVNLNPASEICQRDAVLQGGGIY